MLYSNAMRVLMLSMDARVNKCGTLATERLAALAKQAGEIVALAPDGKGGKVGQLLRLWRHARSVLRARKFDIITVQDTAFVALLAYILARRFHIPLEVQVHGFERLRGVRKVLARFIVRHADKVRVVSERMKKELKTRFKVLDSKMYVLSVYAQVLHTPPRLPSGDTPPQPRRGGEFTFLTVGRLVPIKNIALQIRAFARIAREFPQARLRIVGGGPLAEVLRLQVKGVKLEDRIILEGRQEHIGAFYEKADAFLLTSNAEGWGVVVVEAAAYGLPIIMTDVGCAGEFLQNNENGIVIPVGDKDALVAAMKRVMTDSNLRTRLGQAARAAFRALPNKEEHIQKQLTEWHSVIMR